MLAKQSIVVGLGSDPKPYETVATFDGKRTVSAPIRTDQKRSTFLKCNDG